MNPQDLLSAALDMSGNSDIAGQSAANNVQPSTSHGQPVQQKVHSKDIKPFVLNGQYYYQTPRGVVQFRGNSIVLVPPFELDAAVQAERARRLITMNNSMFGNNLSCLMDNAMPRTLYNGHQSQMAQLNNPAFMTDPTKTTQLLIDSNQTSWGAATVITPQSPQEQASSSNLLTDQLLFEQIAKKVRNKNDFATIYEEVSKEREVDDEEEFQADTYADYMPSKLKIGLKHPDTVVETSSLSSVQPPDVTYSPLIPEEVYDSGRLSALQMEAIVYSCQQHEQFLPNGHRSGFLIGDGAGVGKGRTVAGIIYENYLQGRKKAIWLSISADLKLDAERDLKDIGASHIKVHALNKLKYSKISSSENGKIKKGVIFSTYSSLISESSSAKGSCKSRLNQLLQWCGEDFDGVIIFDECHKAKNLVPPEKNKGGKEKSTKTGLKVKELQDSLPKARIVYASATGASEPRNMAYMVRLGLWGPGTPFPNFSDFNLTVDRRGVGAMELVAIDMKLSGKYIARQLSFKGVSFEIDEIELSEEFVKLYDDCVELWEDAREKFHRALEMMEEDPKKKKHYWGQFWSSHQRFFKYLCIAAKVDRVVAVTKAELKNGNAVVIGLQSTGEARTMEAMEEQGELDDFISTAKAQFQSMIEKHFPAPNRKKTLALLGITEEDSKDYSDPKSRRARQETQRRIKSQSTQSMRDFIASDDSDSDSSRTELEDNETTEPDSANSDNSDEDFLLSDDDKRKRNKKRRVKKKISDDEEEDEQSSSDSDDYTSVESTPFSSAVEEDESDESDEDPCEKYGGKRSKNRKVGRNKRKKKPEFGSNEAGALCEKMRDELLEKFELIAPRLPANSLDDLINKLGGPSEVAEMTGRKGRIVQRDDGEIVYESRKDDASLEMLNISEKNKFMDDEKQIAIISEAASSGISLQADRRAINKRRRIHITIELSFSADRVIQQFGRTHRSNQTSAPKYIFMISKLAGEKRFASVVAKRLQSLGALTHGDRRATESRDLSGFHIDPKYSKPALETVMNVMLEMENSPIPAPEGWTDGKQFFADVRTSMVGVGLLNYNKQMKSYTMEKDTIPITRFLNRVLGMKVRVQNGLFEYFAETMDAYIRHAKRTGRYDQGIMDYNEESASMQVLERYVYELPGEQEDGDQIKRVELQTISVERGIDWEHALRIYGESNDDEEGFYESHRETTVNVGILLAIKDKSMQKSYSGSIFQIYKPNTGSMNKHETLSSLKERFRKVSPTAPKTKEHWNIIYTMSEHSCMHKIWYNKCSRSTKALQCDFGQRNIRNNILSGNILTIWNVIEAVMPANSSKLQIVRLNRKDGNRYVGISIPPGSVDSLMKRLEDQQKISQYQQDEKEAAREAELGELSTIYDDDTDDADDQDVSCLD